MTLPSVIIGLAAIGIGLHMSFFYKLRRDCYDEWTRLGSPNPFLPNDPRQGWQITKYILGGTFERLPDRRLVTLGRVLRCYEWLYVLALVIFVLLFFYSLITG